MTTNRARRRFGNVRKRDSGRWQARYPGPDGQLRSAPRTFATKGEAERWLTLAEAEVMRDEWIDPRQGMVTVADYATRWIEQRPGLRPRTAHLYMWTLRKHIVPYIGGVPIGRLTTPMVRQWRADLLRSGVSESGAAKAYRLLRAVLMTAAKEDELIRRNPCRIPGADQERSAERPTLTVDQVFQLAEAVPDRYAAMVLVATFACLRWGEVVALRRRDVDLDAGVVRVRQAFTEQRGKGLVLGPPKSRAGVRTVALPQSILVALTGHLDAHVIDNLDALIFTTPNGRPIWRGNFNKLVDWKAAVAAVGVPDLHFHDLRHTGNTLAAGTGVSLRDLMARMGHDSPRAALIYQHARVEADQAVASAVDALVRRSGRDGGRPAEGGHQQGPA
jgi:integrase